jgi:manganese/iron transport system permease protein
VWSWILEPIGYQFMQNALSIGVWIGILCPVVGTYLIVQRMSLLGDVMAHSVLPGLAVSFYLKINILVGAFVSGMIGAVLIAWLRSQTRVKVDAIMALMFSSFFALGILLITLLRQKIDLDSFLFGDILSVTREDVWRTGIITAIVLLAVKLTYKEMLFYTFDPIGAKALGMPVDLIYLGLMAGVTLTIIASMQTVGVVLVVSMLIGPAITAYLVVKELHMMMIVGSGIGIASAVGGMYASYYLNVPSGPAIVLFNMMMFLITLVSTSDFNKLLSKLISKLINQKIN